MIYFILNRREGAVKIGYSCDPASRLAQLQTGVASRLELVGTVTGSRGLEKSLHDAFQPWSKNGEWFSWNKKVAHLIGLIMTFGANGVICRLQREALLHEERLARQAAAAAATRPPVGFAALVEFFHSLGWPSCCTYRRCLLAAVKAWQAINRNEERYPPGIDWGEPRQDGCRFVITPLSTGWSLVGWVHYP